MDLQAWGRQRAAYSRARRGRNERGAALAECALVQGITQAMAIRQRAALRGPNAMTAFRGPTGRREPMEAAASASRPAA